MEVENEHLAEIPHLGVLRVRCKGGEVFGLDAVALGREGIHQHRTEAPFVGIVTKTDMVVELAVLQRLAPEVIAARGHFAEELPTLVHTIGIFFISSTELRHDALTYLLVAMTGVILPVASAVRPEVLPFYSTLS